MIKERQTAFFLGICEIWSKIYQLDALKMKYDKTNLTCY